MGGEDMFTGAAMSMVWLKDADRGSYAQGVVERVADGGGYAQ